jgi:DNA-binding transcriptional ArsR family regulator
MTSEPTAGDVFEALANPHRRAILALLSGSRLPLCEITEQLPITRQAVSGHLRFLGFSGLVADEVAGSRRLFRLNERGPVPVQKYLELVFGPDRFQPDKEQP